MYRNLKILLWNLTSRVEKTLTLQIEGAVLTIRNPLDLLVPKPPPNQASLGALGEQEQHDGRL